MQPPNHIRPELMHSRHHIPACRSLERDEAGRVGGANTGLACAHDNRNLAIRL